MESKKVLQKVDTILNLLNHEISADEVHQIISHVNCAYITALREENIPDEELIKYLIDLHNYIVKTCRLSANPNTEVDFHKRKAMLLQA